MRYQDDINTEHNMTKRLTRKGQTRVRNWKGANILLLHWRRGYTSQSEKTNASSLIRQ